MSSFEWVLAAGAVYLVLCFLTGVAQGMQEREKEKREAARHAEMLAAVRAGQSEG